jgi:hypothetical protein
MLGWRASLQVSSQSHPNSLTRGNTAFFDPKKSQPFILVVKLPFSLAIHDTMVALINRGLQAAAKRMKGASP